MEQPTRRTLLRGGLLAFTAVGLRGLQPWPALAGEGSSRLRRSAFVPYEGTIFKLVRAGRTSDARLTAIADLPASAAGDPYRFSLRFEMLGAVPAEGVFSVRHAGMRSVDLFIAPAGGVARMYEAVVHA